MSSTTLSEKSLTTFDISTNIQVVLLVASVYGKQFANAPQRHLGANIAGHELRIGADAWSASADRRTVDGLVVMGCVLCCRRNKHSEETEYREEWFIPFAELDRIGFTFRAVKA